ncbi:MAG: T9SS type A sorting domain-containing protein [Prevotellaceae bacterium]|nr:T9SS type A sorting domain-containing protein [Prevotellaceae bacterium]
MQRLHVFLYLLILGAGTWLRAAVGDWQAYLSYHNATECVAAGEKIYVLFDGNLLVYNTTDAEVRTLSTLDGLHGRHVSLLGYAPATGCVVLVYDNAMIDLLLANGSIVGIPELRDGLDDVPTLLDLTISEQWAILTTSAGVAQLDLRKQELKGFYRSPADAPATAAVCGSTLYVGAEDGLYAGNLLANLNDRNQWTRLSDAGVTLMAGLGQRLYFSTSGTGSLSRGLWILQGESPQSVIVGTVNQIRLSGNTLLAVASGTVRGYTAASTAPAFAYTLTDAAASLCRTNDGQFWQTTGGSLVRLGRSGDALSPTADAIGGYGPRYDLCYYMTYAGARLLIAGGRLDPFDREHYPAAIMTREDGRWSAFDNTSVVIPAKATFRDVTCVLQDPADTEHHWVSATSGLYSFRNGSFEKHYTTTNSPLTSATSSGNPNYVRIDGLNMDAEGNLWMVNNGVDTTLRALRPDGTWRGFRISEIARAPTLEKTLIDRDGRLWVCSRRTVDSHISGLLCLDYGGTLRGEPSLRSTYRSRATNEDGASVSLESVYAIAEALDGRIWVGTAQGLFVVDDPAAWSHSDFHITQIKVPRNDGTNLADYLLAGVPVTAICVDPVDRKWIGTANNGLYLVSADGTEILHHFDTSNSPILSNYVQSIAVDEHTGEVMIGTDKGLCSYTAEATGPSAGLDAGSVHVYPNPFRPEMRGGKITVDGLAADTEVKIMALDGTVVSAGRSTGGRYQWDVHTTSGRQAAAGVYFILLSTPDGKTTTAAKVVVI